MSLSVQIASLATRIGTEFKTRWESLATVATTGSYNDLANKPSIPTVPSLVSAFTNDANYLTRAQITTYLPVINNAGSAISVDVANGYLPVLNNGGSTINVTIS